MIAAITGFCLGGGWYLTRRTSVFGPDAKVGTPAARLSIVYGVRHLARLLTLVGLPAAKRIIYAAGQFGAEEAFRFGFADRIEADPLAAAHASACARG